MICVVAAAGMAFGPMLMGDYILTLATEAAILMLFAASLHLLLGVGGLVTFGHAAYFALGAYGAGLATVSLGWSFGAALIAGAGLGAAGGVVFGWFCVRLSASISQCSRLPSPKLRGRLRSSGLPSPVEITACLASGRQLGHPRGLPSFDGWPGRARARYNSADCDRSVWVASSGFPGCPRSGGGNRTRPPPQPLGCFFACRNGCWVGWWSLRLLKGVATPDFGAIPSRWTDWSWCSSAGSEVSSDP